MTEDCKVPICPFNKEGVDPHTEFALLHAKMDANHEVLERIANCIEGETGNVGMRIEVDRLKQAMGIVKWSVGALVALVASIIANVVHGWIKK